MRQTKAAAELISTKQSYNLLILPSVKDCSQSYSFPFIEDLHLILSCLKRKHCPPVISGSIIYSRNSEHHECISSLRLLQKQVSFLISGNKRNQRRLTRSGLKYLETPRWSRISWKRQEIQIYSYSIWRIRKEGS